MEENIIRKAKEIRIWYWNLYLIINRRVEAVEELLSRVKAGIFAVVLITVTNDLLFDII